MRDEDLPAVLERDDVDDQLAAPERQRQRLVVAAQDQVVHEVRAAYQVGHAHALVAVLAQPQVGFGGRIAPFEEQHIVHDHHAIRQQVHRLPEAGQPFGQFGLVLFVAAPQPVQAREDGRPFAPAIGQLGALRILQPVRQLVQVVQLRQHQCQHGQQRHPQGGNGIEPPPHHAHAGGEETQTQRHGHPEHHLRIEGTAHAAIRPFRTACSPRCAPCGSGVPLPSAPCAAEARARPRYVPR